MEIKKAHRKKVAEWHPDKKRHLDKTGRKIAEDMFKRVCDAYEVLGDPEERKRYDARNGIKGDEPGNAAAPRGRREQGQTKKKKEKKSSAPRDELKKDQTKKKKKTTKKEQKEPDQHEIGQEDRDLDYYARWMLAGVAGVALPEAATRSDNHLLAFLRHVQMLEASGPLAKAEGLVEGAELAGELIGQEVVRKGSSRWPLLREAGGTASEATREYVPSEVDLADMGRAVWNAYARFRMTMP